MCRWLRRSNRQLLGWVFSFPLASSAFSWRTELFRLITLFGDEAVWFSGRSSHADFDFMLTRESRRPPSRKKRSPVNRFCGISSQPSHSVGTVSRSSSRIPSVVVRRSRVPDDDISARHTLPVDVRGQVLRQELRSVEPSDPEVVPREQPRCGAPSPCERAPARGRRPPPGVPRELSQISSRVNVVAVHTRPPSVESRLGVGPRRGLRRMVLRVPGQPDRVATRPLMSVSSRQVKLCMWPRVSSGPQAWARSTRPGPRWTRRPGRPTP